MNDQTERNESIFKRVDFLTLVGAIVTLFIALGTESWWTLTGASTSKLFDIQVSPFYIHISAVGLPNTVPLANSLGSLARTVLLVGFLALFAASIRPTAWWRNLAVYFGVSSLAMLYLSFILMFYWTETTFLNAYGVLPPYFGAAHLQANVLGLDLNLYPTPLVIAAFGVPYYLGFISLGLVFGKTILKQLHERAFQALAVLLPGGSMHSVYLTPPYEQVWFSTGDRQFNPMQKDPEAQTDDELLVSFAKLYEKVEPGGTLSLVIPISATALTDRLERIVSETGFSVDRSVTISRGPERAENELHFTKSAAPASLIMEAETTTNSIEMPSKDPSQMLPETLLAPKVSDAVQAALAFPEPTVEPRWLGSRMTRLEKIVLKAAIKIITDRHQPVQYRELLNQVYMDLVDHKVEFDSARQIEATLLSHNGHELRLVEEEDDMGLPTVKKWSLGNRKMSKDRQLQTLEAVKGAGAKLPHLPDFFRRRKGSRYKSKSSGDDDAGD